MDYLEIIWKVVPLIGWIKILIWLLPWFYTKLFCCISLSKYKYGYVLITGASDGIGKTLAKELARRGFNLILVSRTLSKLESVKSEISSLYPSSQIHVIACDFSFSHKDPINFYNDLFSKLQSFEISVLINNVGVMDVHTLHNSKFEDIENSISVNIYPSTHLTHKLMPVFLERYKETKRRSLVINMSSTADESVAVGMSLYAATKRFNSFFGEGLRYEYDCVDFAVVKPGPVDTPLAAQLGKSVPMKADVDDYVKALLGGLRTGINHGHWKSKVLGTGIRIWPYFLNIAVLRMLIPSAVKHGYVR